MAQAVGARGLPNLQMFLMGGLNKVTGVGFGALAYAVVNGSPKLEFILVSAYNARNVFRGVVEAAGRTGVYIV